MQLLLFPSLYTKNLSKMVKIISPGTIHQRWLWSLAELTTVRRRTRITSRSHSGATMLRPTKAILVICRNCRKEQMTRCLSVCLSYWVIIKSPRWSFRRLSCFCCCYSLYMLVYLCMAYYCRMYKLFDIISHIHAHWIKVLFFLRIMMYM